jgi:leucyl aminopeptidase
MIIKLDATGDQFLNCDLKILTAFQVEVSSTSKTKGKGKATKTTESPVSIAHWQNKTLVEEFMGLRAAATFKANKDETLTFTGALGETILVVGLGKKDSFDDESIRKSIAKVLKAHASKFSSIGIDVEGFNTIEDDIQTAALIAESIGMCDYTYDNYKSKKTPKTDCTIFLAVDKKNASKIEKEVASVKNITNSINVARDFVNEVPNVLNSVEYAKRIEDDVKKNLKGVKIKVLNKAQLKKENMNLFLSVNAGSAHEARLVHLTYEPAKSNAKTKHVCLVGKGLTFDTGGYSLKPGASMMGMKYDMAGSATVYGAFRAAVLEKAPIKITCILAMTDNAVNEMATMPDSVVTARNGTTVEILNTDAEGRLVLADAFDYACDLKPHYLIDAATLTGACLVALGSQVAGVMGNDDEFYAELKNHADANGEYIWQLPIIEEWRQDIKSKIADIKNIGTPMRAGTTTAAAFLECFIKNDVKWAHFDIAGVADSASHLPYCPANGASGLIIRTLTSYLLDGK